MSTDAELLHEFVADHSEAAFAELVHRHLPMVRATAVRRLGGNFHAADDVTQQVFVSLARKASSLRGHATLAGWLYVSTHHATAEAVRGDHRRRQREATAHSMQLIDSSTGEPDEASRLRPLLDDALVTLKPAEREAVVLRYFANHTYSEIAAVAQLSEDAARKRVDRALEKLHATLMRRGVNSSLAALGVALTAGGVGNPPAGLAAKVAGAALTEAAMPAAGISVSSLIWPIAATAILGVGIIATLSQRRENAAAAATLASLEAGVQVSASTVESSGPQVTPDSTGERPAEKQLKSVDEPAIQSAAPAPGAAATHSAVVYVSPEGTLQWNGERVTLDKFLARLAEHHESAPNGESQVVVEANGSRFSQMLYVLEESRKAGINSLVIESDAFPDGNFRIWF